MAQFRARARTVDMLGRQQIAGIATAISELFKNAHDAYARRVEVDYYRPTDLFVLRDDGLGMTEADFKERWLTLGTESKLAGGAPVFRPDGEPERPVMGEKGIGRLAIARIGTQVLVLSRARRQDGLHPLVAGFINWELFEIPGVNLDEIEIPVQVFANGELPRHEDVRKLILAAQESLVPLQSRLGAERCERIRADLDQFNVDPQHIDAFLNDARFKETEAAPLTLKGEGSGTQFFIRPTDRFLAAEIDADRRSKEEAVFTKFLLGFTNTIVPGAPEPVVNALFRDWRNPESPMELIGGGEFITAADFQSADHHFSGRFDEFGQFSGDVTIYNQSPIRHVIPWEDASGKPTLCGPFTINVAYIQGNQRESRLAPEEHARVCAKLERIGGIYVYRDGIRVLPYGNSDFDWLHIEERRTRGASYYYFSHRRIFGALEITRKENSALVEKAGREGFQTNRAYRQLTAILENFFIQLAADFFRDEGANSAVYAQRKAELENVELARRKREKLVSERKRQFDEELTRFFSAAEQKAPEQAVTTVFAGVELALNNARAEQNPDNAAVLLFEAEADANRRLSEVRNQHNVQRPRGVGLGQRLQREWEAYTMEQERLEREVFVPAQRRITETIGEAAAHAMLAMDQRRRLKELLDQLVNETSAMVRSREREARVLASKTQDAICNLARKVITDMDEAVRLVRTDLQRLDLTGVTPGELEQIRDKFESRISAVAHRGRGILDQVQDQLREFSWIFDGEEKPIGAPEMTAALEEELLALRERADADAELVQLGMALAVINHEFDATIRSIRSGLRRFKPWADKNAGLGVIYQDLRSNFDHLDGYLRLFTPLQRRLYRKRIPITGGEIAKFLRDLFDERFDRNEIEFHLTPAFRDKTVIGYPSTFFPVFVNMVDNAIFWLKDRPRPRIIALDADEVGFLLANNGPAIPMRDRESVFELGFTRKPGGRGLGLHISRQVLRAAGFDLRLDDSSSEYPVCFRISEVPNSEDKNEEATPK